MNTWHRTDHRGQQIAFTYTVDGRGRVTLTREEVEGLMRAGGWQPGPIVTFAEVIDMIGRGMDSAVAQVHTHPEEDPR